jgi:hypothetical protein
LPLSSQALSDIPFGIESQVNMSFLLEYWYNRTYIIGIIEN